MSILESTVNNIDSLNKTSIEQAKINKASR